MWEIIWLIDYWKGMYVFGGRNNENKALRTN